MSLPEYISVAKTVVYYQATCPVCGWVSWEYDTPALHRLTWSATEHIGDCQKAVSIGLERAGKDGYGIMLHRHGQRWEFEGSLLSPESGEMFYCDWRRTSDRAILVYIRPYDEEDAADGAELVFVSPEGLAIETYHVAYDHHWQTDGAPWLEEGSHDHRD